MDFKMVKISDETNINRIEHKSKKNMALGAIIGYLAILVSIVHGVVLTPIVTMYVGIDNYGLYGIATTIIALFLLDLGLGTVTETYLSKLRAAGDKDSVQRFLSTIFKIYLVLTAICLIIVGVIYFLSPYLYKSSYSQEQISMLQNLILIVGGYALVSFPTNTFSSVITVYEKFGFNKTADLVQKLIYLGLTIAAVKLNWGLIGVTAVNAGSGIVAIIMRYLYMRLYLGVKLDLRLKFKGTRSELKSILVFSAWGIVIALLTRLVFNITPSILGMVSSSDQVTKFMYVNTIEGYVYMFGAMTATFFMAKVARVESTGTPEEKREKLLALAKKVGKLQFVVIALIIFGFATVGREFISFWLKDILVESPDFSSIYWCILAVVAYEIVHIPELPIYNAMLTEGHIKPLAINTIIKATINVGLSFVLSSYYGANGACLAIAIARVADLILNNFAYRKYLGINLGEFFSFVYIKGAIVIAISFGIGLLTHFFMPIDNLPLKFTINGVIFVVIFSLSVLYILFSKEERKYYINQILILLHIRKDVSTEKPKEETTEESEKKEEIKSGEEN
ncbi:MAG: polysaccharide biosynthesis protein [Bacilli bacterium]|nr:polysaccharide biosynthesis protein [Bacilli bacterium]